MNIQTNIEHWMIIDGFDIYEISSFGRVRNNKTLQIISNWKDKDGYYSVGLYKDKKRKFLRVHRLVAFAFCENDNKYNMVDHIDRNVINNKFENLRWVSHSINNKNKKTPTNNTSGTKGVIFRKERNKWMATWSVDGVVKTKLCDSKEEAIQYRKEMEGLHGYIN